MSAPSDIPLSTAANAYHVSDAKRDAAVATFDAVDLDRTREIMVLALAVGITTEQSVALVAAKLRDWRQRDQQRTLADRCFDAGRSDDELFDALQVLCGGRPTEECLAPGFVWHVINSWVDAYDSSVEVVLSSDVPALTRAQIDSILALGFGQVYESQGERGAVWTRASVGKCGSKAAPEESCYHIIAKLRAEIAQLRSTQKDTAS